MERMSALDASFLDLENEAVSLHIGAVAVFEGPVPARKEIEARYADAVRRIPRYRQRMQRVPFGVARPVWVDDEHFDLGAHLKYVALPAPGDEVRLQRLIGRLMSYELDPDLPLWEAWVLEGLAGDRWALVTKVHHSVADGVGGLALFTAVLDGSPGVPRPWVRRESPGASPSRTRLLVDAVWDRAAAVIGAVDGVAALAVRPARLVQRAGILVSGLPGYLRLARPSPRTSLTGPLGRPRRFRITALDLAEVQDIRHALGGTVNDVVLAGVTAGMRQLLISRDEEVRGGSVRCLVPVSVRHPGDEDAAANHVSALVLDMPVEFADPATAFAAVKARMSLLKTSHESQAGELVVSAAETLPAPMLSAALRGMQHLPHRAITTVTTNVPGPQTPATLLGRPMVALYPYVPIADVLRVGVAVVSYAGRLHFGVTCDRDSVPDADVFVTALENAFADLAKLAAEAAPVGGRA